MAHFSRHNFQHTLALISTGFYEFAQTSSNYLSSIPVIHKTVAVVSVILSSILLAVYRPRTRRMEGIIQQSNTSNKGIFHKMQKWRLIKLSCSAVERLLCAFEYLITPSIACVEKQSPTMKPDQVGTPCELNGVPKLLNLRHISSSGTHGETPNNNRKPYVNSDEWTPFSSVSTTESGAFDRSCASLMNDLSRSTVSTPITDLRQQVATKIRTWRLALKDLDDGPQLLTWSPDSKQAKQASLVGRIWSSLTGWLPFGSGAPVVPGSAQRKRKRIEGDEDDDDLALYIPQHKGQPKDMNGDDRSVAVAEPPAGIRGLSVVPIIGNWFSAENDTAPAQRDQVKSDAANQLDHIALVQHSFLSPGKAKGKAKNVTNGDTDNEPYEILELEDKVIDLTEKLNEHEGPSSTNSDSSTDTDSD